MANKSLMYFCALILMSFFGAFALATGMDGREDKEETAAAAASATCLACHGSFDDLIKATAGFTASSGETTSPHRYIPHDDMEGIPECTECHIPHAIPIENVSAVVKPDNVDWCYDNCHHARNLSACSTCH
jgi:hypothetical protein